MTMSFCLQRILENKTVWMKREAVRFLFAQPSCFLKHFEAGNVFGKRLAAGNFQHIFNRIKQHSVKTYHKEGPACGKIPCDPPSSEARPCQQSCRDGLRMSALQHGIS